MPVIKSSLSVSGEEEVLRMRLFLFAAIFIIGCSAGDNIPELYTRGIKEYQEKQFEQAESTFKSVIEADDDFLNAYLMLAKIYYYKKDYNNSILVLEELIKRDRDHAGALYWKARALVMSNQEKTDESIGLLKRVLESDSSHIPARLLLAILYEKKGNHREAIHEYITILGEEDNLLSARGNLAILYMRLGLKERGKSEIEKAVRIAEITGSGIKNINYIKSEFEKWEEK